MGIALLLSGIGFIVLAAGLLGPEGLRRRREGVQRLATKLAAVVGGQRARRPSRRRARAARAVTFIFTVATADVVSDSRWAGTRYRW